MKKTIFFMLVAGFIASCHTGQSEANLEERKIEYDEFIDNPTEISFEEMKFDVGTVKDGEIVHHKFKFKKT